MNLNLLPLALDIAFGVVAVSLALCAWRLVFGPGTMDRVLAIDTLYINAVALVVLLAIRQQKPVLFEAALVMAMLGFVATTALARYLTRGDVVE